MTTPLFELTPKAAFQVAHKLLLEQQNDYAGGGLAQASLSAALAEMALRQQATDPLQRAHNASKLEGAKEFIRIWLNIGRPVGPQEAVEMPTLRPIK